LYDAITPINASGITSSTSLTATTTIHTWCCRPVCKGTDYLLKLLIIILISTWEWKFWVNIVDLDSLISMQFRDQCLIPELSLQCMTITGYQRWRSMLDPWKIPAVYDHHGISKMEINAWSLKYPCSVWPSRDIKDGDQCLILRLTTQNFWLLIIQTIITIILLNQIIKSWKIKGCKNMKAKAWGELSVPF